MSWLFMVEESHGALFEMQQAPIFGNSSSSATPAELFDRRQESAKQADTLHGVDIVRVCTLIHVAQQQSLERLELRGAQILEV